jgi:hypothetical protein
MTRRTAMMAAMLAASLACAKPADAARRPRFGGSLRIATVETPRTVFPTEISGVIEAFASSLAYETLTGPGGLARSAAAGGDSLTWRVALEPDVRFHDETPCDAAAVVRSLQRAFDSPAGRRLVPRDVAVAPEVQVASPFEIEIRLAFPDSDFASTLADPRLAIASDEGSGTGPFRIAGFDGGTSPGAVRVRLAAFDEHRRGRPYLDEVEFRAVRDMTEAWLLFGRGEACVIPDPSAGGIAWTSGPVTVVVAADYSLVYALAPVLQPIRASALAGVLHPESMLRFLPPDFAVAPALKGMADRADERGMPGDIEWRVRPRTAGPLATVAERVLVDLLDAGARARLVAEAPPGAAIEIAETFAREAPPGAVPLLVRARRFAVCDALRDIAARGAGLGLENAWLAEP